MSGLLKVALLKFFKLTLTKLTTSKSYFKLLIFFVVLNNYDAVLCACFCFLCLFFVIVVAKVNLDFPCI